MKRLQIMIDEDLGWALDRLAREQHTSKAALIRRFVREHVAPMLPGARDPLGDMIGADDAEPAEIDEVVYGRSQTR